MILRIFSIIHIYLDMVMMLKNNQNKLGIFIEIECKRQNISVKELALKSSISEDMINKLKRGVIKSPSIVSLHNLANGFGIPFKILLEEIGEIDSVYEYALNNDESEEMIQKLIPYLSKCRIDHLTLNDSEKLDLANSIMFFLNMISKKYK